MDAAAQALDAAKVSGDLGQIGTASQALADAVNQYLQLAGVPTDTASLGAVPTPSGG